MSITCAAQAQFITPTWESSWIGGASFSSARTADLNNDGIEDLVVGAGIEDSPSNLGIVAINGATGDTLWTKKSRNQIYSTAIYANSAVGSEKLVYLSGRDAQLLCLNGSNGHIIWDFWPDTAGSAAASGWFNFYTPRFIGNDNENLLITNGGKAAASPGDPNRPPGRLMILDRFTGEILYENAIPDGSETYFSPMIWPLSESFGGDLLVMGSGGETLPGALWSIGLEEFKLNGLKGAESLIKDSEKGFIQATAFGDLNSDGEYDLIAPRMNNGGLIALDGLTKKELWTFEIPNSESYASPIIADFTGDGLPDVFSLFARGEFPIYFNYDAHLIDGQSGKSLYNESLALNQFSSGNALDWDSDGVDELLLIQNIISNRGLEHAFRIFDFNNDTSYFITEYKNGNVVFSTPLIADVDQDGLLEIVYVFDPEPYPGFGPLRVAFGRYDLDLPVSAVSWGGYMGNFEDGTYRENLNDSLAISLTEKLNAFPNPASKQLRIIDGLESIDRVQIFDLMGKECDVELEKFGRNYLINTSNLSPGQYILRVSNGEKEMTQKVVIQ